MDVTYYDLLKMRHARAIAEVSFYVAQAAQDTANHMGWSCDWSIGMNQALAEARQVESEIEKFLKL